MSTLAIRLAGFLDLEERLPTDSSVVAVLEALVTLMSMAVRAFRLATFMVEILANSHALDVQDVVAVLVLLGRTFEFTRRSRTTSNSFDLGDLGSTTCNLLLRCHDSRGIENKTTCGEVFGGRSGYLAIGVQVSVNIGTLIVNRIARRLPPSKMAIL